jgi:ribosomal protein S18 acetylase RimI-like enzyme
MNEAIKPLEKRHASAVARLHRIGIDSGFLSSLGPMFLRQLYKAVPSCPSGFGYVWEEPDGQVLGFIACAESTGRLYKQSLLRRGVLMAFPLLRFIVRPSIIKRMYHTLRYPSQVGEDLPAAEVLSVVVSSHARGKGVGVAIMKAALGEFAARKIAMVKVAVGASNEAGNKFYKKCGFELALTREHHGLPMNIYTVATASEK